MQRKPDISKAKRLFGWEPKIDLEAGLQLSLEYFQSTIDAEATAK
jgi:nucleoside-diphosphate-sugar epimerase